MGFIFCGVGIAKHAKYTIPASHIFDVENVDFPETRWKSNVEKLPLTNMSCGKVGILKYKISVICCYYCVIYKQKDKFEANIQNRSTTEKCTLTF